MKKNVFAFTLMELLMVIAIIAILVLMLFPAVRKAKYTAAFKKAQVAANDLETAFTSYFNEYKRWPTGLCGGQTEQEDCAGLEVREDMVAMLAGRNIADQNPRLMPFLEVPTNTLTYSGGSYIDPWGNPYKFMLDYNMDNKVDIDFEGAPTNLNCVVAVWSRGIDGSDAAGFQRDNPRSW